MGDGKIAARLRGTELRTSPSDTECPICFLHYQEVNVTNCCQANLCSECYLQVRPQRDPLTACPFCNSVKLQIQVAQRLDPQAIQRRAKEEQLVIEATIRARVTTTTNNSPVPVPSVTTTTTMSSSDETTNGAATAAPASPGRGGSSEFGSSLAQDNRIASIRARSESFASESSAAAAHNTSSESLIQDIAALAMTPEERAQLEQEVRTQHFHPLAQRMEAEQMERRLQNEREYYRSQAGRLRELRARRELMMRTLGAVPAGRPAGAPSLRGLPDWNRLMAAQDGGSRGQSLDDLVVLEAALMLSMEEEARRVEQQDGSDSGRRGDGADELPSASNGTAQLASHLSNMMRALESTTRREQGPMTSRLPANTSSSRAAASELDFASILLRGMSEEEQIAMAIAASLDASGTSTPGESNPSTAGLDSSGRDSLDIRTSEPHDSLSAPVHFTSTRPAHPYYDDLQYSDDEVHRSGAGPVQVSEDNNTSEVYIGVNVDAASLPSDATFNETSTSNNKMPVDIVPGLGAVSGSSSSTDGLTAIEVVTEEDANGDDDLGQIAC